MNGDIGKKNQSSIFTCRHQLNHRHTTTSSFPPPQNTYFCVKTRRPHQLRELMAAMASTSFFSTSSSSLVFRHTPFLCPNSFSVSSLSQFKKGDRGLGHVLVQVNCVSERSKQTVEPDSEIDPSPSSSESSSSSSSASVGGDNDSDISAYKWIAALGGIGFLETVYLTYLKVANLEAFCPTGGGSCSTILTSDYSSVFGVPLPLFGMFAYGLVAGLGIQLGSEKSVFDTGKSDGEILLVGLTTSMAVASAYFLYILSTEFAGESCLYCLASATLSFSLFIITLKKFGLQELQKILGLQLFVASLVVIALTASYNTAQSGTSSMSETEIPYFETEITKESSPLAFSLAKHLHSIGAKLYGAFWCSHCHDQKEIFGKDAAKILDYVECFPDGVYRGTKMAQACLDAKLEGFPTWEINGQVLSGEKQLSELAILSGFKAETK